MKSIIAATIILATGITTAEANTLTGEQICPSVGQLAENIMNNRQLDMPMDKVMGIADAAEDEIAKKMARALIIDAYTRPAFSSDEYRLRATAQFKNEMLLECYKAFK